MIDSRTYILDRIKSRKISIEEFNFDKLSAPPISLMFTQQDIQDLYYNAHSIKLASHPEKKLKNINDIMSRRGFVKFIGGTNRISYRPIEDNSFLVKVAIDDVGRADNPREFKNQHALKPFVTKVFEVTPCGTLGVFERVIPITNRQEYMSVSEDIFTLINEWLIGEYVMDDIGSNYFMNYGIRKNFGVVLLDYPYMYKVDYNKLFCALEDKTYTTKSGKCEGEIDYDDGYNKLVCKKCGAIYKAIDLAKAIEDEKVIIKGGNIKMSLKINISGGSKNAKETVEINDNSVSVTPSKPIAPSNFSNTSSSLNINITKEDIPNIIEDNKNEETIEEQHEVVEDEQSISNTSEKSEEPKESAASTEVSAQESGEITTPIVFHEDDSERLKQIKEEAEKEINKSSLKDDENDIYDYLNSCDPKMVTKAITKYIEDHCYIHSTFAGITENTTEDGTKVLGFNYHINIPTDDDENIIEIMAEDDFITLGVNYSVIYNFLNENGIDLKSITAGESYNGFCAVAGKIICKKDIDINAESYKVIALIDNNGNYITNSNNEIITIEILDDRSTANISIVSNQWKHNIENQLKKFTEENVDSNKSSDNEVKEVPVGAVPTYTETIEE